MKDTRNKINYSCIIKAQLPVALQAVYWGSVNISVRLKGIPSIREEDFIFI